ncbi:hypothetical protein SAMN02745220_02148 [Desulfopila aestuarii DSM 18488]|uniref:Uncharacterized protein n=1 Tax=Desulfopila aestuarii DSM 18488 TaxID=1121416 RepID=A0A1M7Y6A9_9BACT|nr:hypothetical protein SAMN02745220_02148 [Desulfopila aestuarii DSM 18488]
MVDVWQGLSAVNGKCAVISVYYTSLKKITVSEIMDNCRRLQLRSREEIDAPTRVYAWTENVVHAGICYVMS